MNCQWAQNTNLYTMVTAPWYTSFCYPKTDLIQALTKSDDTQLIDAINTYNVDKLSYAFDFNGTDNYVDCGIKIQGQTPINISGNGKITLGSSNRSLFSAGAGGNAEKGIAILISSSLVMYIYISDGATRPAYNFGTLPSNIVTSFNFSWSGISGDNGTLTVNGVDYVHSLAKDWTGNSGVNLLINSWSGGGFYTKGYLYKSTFTINNNPEALLPFCQTDGTVWNVKDNDQLTIQGTVTTAQYILQSYYHYLNNYGYSNTSGTIYPASQDGTGKDVLSNTLSCPAIENGLNSGCKVQYPDVAVLKTADVNNILYDASGNARELEVSDLPSNDNNQIFANKSEFDNGVAYCRTILVYDAQKSDAEIEQIARCKAKENSILQSCWVWDDVDQDYVYDKVTATVVIDETQC